MVALTDEELIKQALREVLTAKGTPSGKQLEAKASAARQLAKLCGLAVDEKPSEEDEGAPDPMDDLDQLEALRIKRSRSRTA